MIQQREGSGRRGHYRHWTAKFSDAMQLTIKGTFLQAVGACALKHALGTWDAKCEKRLLAVCFGVDSMQ